MCAWRLFSLFCLSTLIGCRGVSLIDHAKAQADDTVEKTTAKVEKLVSEAKASLTDTLREAKEEYKGALKDTSAEVTKLREDIDKSLAELDRRTQERIEQLRASAAELVRQGDASVQARIDQLFAELRRFSDDTLAQIAKLIQPVLDMAAKIGTAVENGDKHVAAILEKVTPILDSVKAGVDSAKSTLDEARKGILQLRGKDPETGQNSESPWWTRGLLGFLAAAFAAWRKMDQRKNGDRWKREELEANTRTDSEKLIREGVFDDEIAGRIIAGAFDEHIRARLVHLGVLRVQTAVPPREGGDPSSPQVLGGPTPTSGV